MKNPASPEIGSLPLPDGCLLGRGRGHYPLGRKIGPFELHAFCLYLCLSVSVHPHISILYFFIVEEMAQSGVTWLLSDGLSGLEPGPAWATASTTTPTPMKLQAQKYVLHPCKIRKWPLCTHLQAAWVPPSLDLSANQNTSLLLAEHQCAPLLK